MPDAPTILDQFLMQFFNELDQADGASIMRVVNRYSSVEQISERLRGLLATQAQQEFITAVAPTIEIIRARVNERLDAIAQIEDPELMQERLRALRADVEQMMRDVRLDPPGAQTIQNLLAAAWANGMAEERT
jgi:hypothetical protein